MIRRRCSTANHSHVRAATYTARRSLLRKAGNLTDQPLPEYASDSDSPSPEDSPSPPPRRGIHTYIKGGFVLRVATLTFCGNHCVNKNERTGKADWNTKKKSYRVCGNWEALTDSGKCSATNGISSRACGFKGKYLVLVEAKYLPSQG